MAAWPVWMVARRVGRLAVLVGLLVLATGPARAQGLPGVSGITAFGDSLTDTGNLGPAAPKPPYFDGRFSNGPIWIDRFAALTGLQAESLALGGARAVLDTPVDLRAQIVRHLLDEGGESGDRLYVLWIGANDYLAYRGGADPDPGGFVRRVVGAIVDGMELLARFGARRFLVLNLPPIGRTPEVAADGPAAQVVADRLVAMHNGLLAVELTALRTRRDIVVTEVDVDSTIQDLFRDPGAYGIANLRRPCIDSGGLPPYPPTGACPTPEATAAALFWDRLHPTSTAHGAVADAALAALLARPSG